MRIWPARFYRACLNPTLRGFSLRSSSYDPTRRPSTEDTEVDSYSLFAPRLCGEFFLKQHQISEHLYHILIKYPEDSDWLKRNYLKTGYKLGIWTLMIIFSGSCSFTFIHKSRCDNYFLCRYNLIISVVWNVVVVGIYRSFFANSSNLYLGLISDTWS